MRFIVGIAGLFCIGLFLLDGNEGLYESIATGPQDIPMPIVIDRVKSKDLADDKQLTNVAKLKPATAVVRVGTDIGVPTPFDLSFTLPSDGGGVVNVGEDLAVGAIDYSRFYTDEIQSVGARLDAYEPVTDGMFKQVVTEGPTMNVGTSKSQIMSESNVMVGIPLEVP